MRVLGFEPEISIELSGYLSDNGITIYYDVVDMAMYVITDQSDLEVGQAIADYYLKMPDLTPRQFSVMLNRLFLRGPIEDLMSLLRDYDYDTWALLEPELHRSNVYFYDKTVARMMSLGPAIAELAPEINLTVELVRTSWETACQF